MQIRGAFLFRKTHRRPPNRRVKSLTRLATSTPAGLRPRTVTARLASLASDFRLAAATKYDVERVRAELRDLDDLGEP